MIQPAGILSRSARIVWWRRFPSVLLLLPIAGCEVSPEPNDLPFPVELRIVDETGAPSTCGEQGIVQLAAALDLYGPTGRCCPSESSSPSINLSTVRYTEVEVSAWGYDASGSAIAHAIVRREETDRSAVIELPPCRSGTCGNDAVIFCP